MTIRVRSDFSLIFIFLIDDFHSWKGNFLVCCAGPRFTIFANENSLHRSRAYLFEETGLFTIWPFLFIYLGVVPL